MLKKRILAVDDEPEVLSLLEKRLTSAGYQVLTASSGSEALEIASSQRPDLIILDILMPDMDGSQVACQLREDPRTKGIPVIFLTCLYTKREEHAAGHVLGANLFLAKPYEPAELLKEIEHVIGKGSVEHG